MTKLQRIRKFFGGIVTFLFAVLLFPYPEDGRILILLFLGVTFLFSAVQALYYYFSMARHMVGGKLILYKGMILVDLAVFTLMLQDVPPYYIMLYLLVSHAFSGVINILGALDARRLKATYWRLKLAAGTVNLGLCGFCLITIRSPQMMVYIYAIGLMHSSIIRIITAFQKTAIIYIP